MTLRYIHIFLALLFTSFIPGLFNFKDQNIFMLLLGVFYIVFAYSTTFKKRKISNDVFFISSIFLLYLIINIFIHRYFKPWYIFGPFLFTSTILLKSYITPYFNKILKVYIFITISLLLIVIFQIIVTGELLFLRNQNIYLESFFKIFPVNNPNFYSRTVICIIPLLLLAKNSKATEITKNNHNTMKFKVLIISLVISVIFIAASRTNTLALITFYITYSLFLNKTYLLYVISILVLISIALITPSVFESIDQYLNGKLIELKKVFFELYYTFIYSSKDVLDVEQNRTKMYYGSYLIIKDNLFFGVGSQGPQQLANLGAREVVLENGLARLKSIHGGFLSITVTGGLFSLGLFLTFIIYIWRNFSTDKSNVTPIAISFLTSTLVSQIAANIYEMLIFWLTLALLFIFHNQEIQMKKTDN